MCQSSLFIFSSPSSYLFLCRNCCAASRICPLPASFFRRSRSFIQRVYGRSFPKVPIILSDHTPPRPPFLMFTMRRRSLIRTGAVNTSKSWQHVACFPKSPKSFFFRALCSLNACGAFKLSRILCLRFHPGGRRNVGASNTNILWCGCGHSWYVTRLKYNSWLKIASSPGNHVSKGSIRTGPFPTCSK